MGKEWRSGGKVFGNVVGKRWESGGKAMRTRWEGGGKVVGKRWGSGGKVVGKLWESGGKVGPRQISKVIFDLTVSVIEHFAMVWVGRLMYT